MAGSGHGSVVCQHDAPLVADALPERPGILLEFSLRTNYAARTYPTRQHSASAYSRRAWIMDDRRFDTLARSLATGRSRRDLLKRVLGGSAGVVAAGTLGSRSTEAARRGFSGPTFPTWTPCVRDAQGACCTSGVLEPGGFCCANGMTDSFGYCCDPNSGGAWTGCCCTPPPTSGGLQECVC